MEDGRRGGKGNQSIFKINENFIIIIIYNIIDIIIIIKKVLHITAYLKSCARAGSLL